MKKIKKNSFVVFNVESCDKKTYVECYKDIFPIGKLFVFLGEVKQAPGHCILADLETGKIIGLYHTQNFRTATDHYFFG